MNSSLYQYRENLILNGSSIKCSLENLTKHLESRGKSSEKLFYFIDTRRRFYEHEMHSITVYPAFQLEKDSDSDAKNSVRFHSL
jgi:hypothetical protein